MDIAWQCISESLRKCLVGRYGGCFEERYKEAYDDSVSCQGFGCTGEVCANSRGEKGQCMVPKRLEKVWVGGSVNFRILTLVRRTHALIIGTLNLIGGSQRDRYPEEECMGVWLSLHILDSWYVYSNIRTLQRLVIHLVARVL